MKTLISVAVLAFVSFFQKGECTISAWTLPSIATADGGSGTLALFLNHGLASGTATGITIAATASAGSQTYALASQTPTDVTLAIDNSGVVTISSGTVDFATTTSYTFIITSNDADGTAASATVTLSVNDVPAFTATHYGHCIGGATASGTTLTTLTATDTVASTLTYAISSGNTNTDWAVVSGTGVITTANALAQQTTGGYTLVYTATDSNTPALVTTASIWIVVSSTCSSGATAVLTGFITLLMALMAHLY